MKFTCERCGKKYATAENPAPGRVYKLKCKACGHLIVVKAAAAHASEHAGSTPPEPPSIGLEIGTPEPAPVPAGSHAFDATTDVSTAQMRVQHDLELTPRRGDSGYVDLFSDVTSETPQKSEDPFLAAARNSLPEGYGSGGSKSPDPFAGLREDISATSAPSEPPPRSHPAVPKVPVIPKPRQEKSAVPLVLIGAGVAVMVGILAFVMLSAGKKETPRATPPPAVATPAPAAAPPAVVVAPPETARAAPVTPVPAQAAPPPQVDDAEKRARAEQKRREREQADARAEQARAERARAEQARAEQVRADREARAARETRDREAKALARAEKDARDRAAREARERDKAERDAKAKADREAKAQRDREEREARAQRERDARDAKERERLSRQVAAADSAAAEPDGDLSQAQIEGVLRSTKSAFDSCIQAARGAGEKLDGRRVMLRLNIQTTGAVTYPTLDDVTLNGTELGTCLKSAARLMVFPKFKGDTMHVEVPLVMR